jgi:hypothetical protein
MKRMRLGLMKGGLVSGLNGSAARMFAAGMVPNGYIRILMHLPV